LPNALKARPHALQFSPAFALRLDWERRIVMKSIFCVLSVIGLSLAPLKSQAQERASTPAPEMSPAETKPAASVGKKPARNLALGLTLDLLPIVMSATAGEFGMSSQVWLGVDHLRFRLVGAQLSQPNWLAARDGFQNQSSTVGALIFDYVFGDHFDKWWIGTGIEVWRSSIGHEDAGRHRACWTNAVWTAGAGYIWPVYGNFYLEPWGAAHVVLNDPQIVLAGKSYNPRPVMGEVSLKVGWFLDL
jgi:hypothetical protein